MTQLSTLPALSTDFERTTALSPMGGSEGSFSVQLDPGWSSLVGIHGGYMCAIAVRGAEALAPDRSVRTLTTSFLRTGSPGPATLAVTELRRGRSLSTMVAALSQEGRTLITSRVTLLTERAGLEWSSPPAVDDMPRLEECVRFEPASRVSHFRRVEARLDPAYLPGKQGGRALVRGYLRPLESRSVDAAWLAMATDWFPPPAFLRVAPPTGGVSVDLTTHIHRPHVVLGEDDWLQGTFEVQDSTGGLAVEHGRIALADGTLVAESFQTRLTAQD